MSAQKKTVYVYNGPNLNLLGVRDPKMYGSQTLADLEAQCQKAADELGLELVFGQTNHEGELIDWIHAAGEKCRAGQSVGMVLNAGAWTHTSLALADAISGAGVPLVEVHISNVYAREEFRHHSFLSPVAEGVIAGLGFTGYELGMKALAERVDQG